MSGHNKWSSIKHKKGAADAKRGKLFSRLGKEITLAARFGGGDAELNPRLRGAIDVAKNANMPNDNVERAVKKGTGELEGGPLEELIYEGYGPGGVALLISCLSDNRNRTAANMRAIFSRHNCTMAESGAVSWLFNRKSRFVVEGPKADEETLLEIFIQANADVEEVEADEGGQIEILGAPDAFETIYNVLRENEIPMAESSLTFVPDTNVLIDEPGIARQASRLIEALEEDEDAQAVYNNLEFSDNVMQVLMEQ